MARGSYLKKEEYEYIKLLHSKGRKISEIVDTTGRSDKTVRRACRTSDYTNYIDTNHAERKARDIREAEQQKMDLSASAKADFAKAMERVFAPKDPERKVKYKVEVTVWEYQY